MDHEDANETAEGETGLPEEPIFANVCEVCREPAGFVFVDGHGWIFKHLVTGTPALVAQGYDHYALHPAFVQEAAERGCKKK